MEPLSEEDPVPARKMTLQEKAMVMATAIAIDLDYFSRQWGYVVILQARVNHVSSCHLVIKR
jgi:hypothetical protein